MKDMCITISGLKLTCLSLRAVAITHTRIALNHQNWSSSTLVLDFEPKMMDMYIYTVCHIHILCNHAYLWWLLQAKQNTFFCHFTQRARRQGGVGGWKTSKPSEN